jgi:hypothetical protein
MFVRACSWLRRAFLSLSVLAAVPAPVLAQCAPDLLDGGACCQQAQVNLPNFPAHSDRVRFITFQDCQTRIDGEVCIDLSAPIPAQLNGVTVCGIYLIRFQIKTCSATPQVLWSGTMRAHYARNWLETDPAGNAWGVWRFLLNGDMVPSQFLLGLFGNNQNVVPRCYHQFGRVFWHGYVDYAFDCGNNVWRSAGALNHEKDFVHHDGASQRPGVFHPTRSFDWVWPSLGFVVDPSSGPVSIGQGSTFESIRKNNFALAPSVCQFEERIVQANVTPLSPLCPCASASPSLQYIPTDANGMSGCNTSFRTSPNVPFPFFQKRIGSWTDPTTFPGFEFLLFDMGFIDYIDGCGPGFPTQQFFEGVETIRGWPAMTYTGAPLPLQFEDWGSSNGLGGAVLFGAPHVTWYLINLNL